MLPMLVNFLITVIGGPRQDNWLGYFSQFVGQLMTPLGIGIGIVGAIVGTLVMYTAPKTPITS